MPTRRSPRSSPQGPTSCCSTCSSTRAAASTCCARCTASSPASHSTCCPTSPPSPTAATPNASARAASSTKAPTLTDCATWSRSAPRVKGRSHMQVAAAVIAMHPAEKRMPAPRKHATSCSSCNLRELCLPGALDAEDLARIDNLVYARRRVKRGDALYQAGVEFNAIYAIRSGSFKASLFDGEGREQVSGFFMAGELLGLEGLGSGTYGATAIALEDSEVCVLPYALIEELAREVPALQRRLHTVLAREIVRDHGVMMLLGT